jgi:Domain of unknown function (DUF222)
MSRSAEIEELTVTALALGASVRGLGDDELLEESAAWEAFGRLADARRAALAAEVQWRSRPQLRDEGLAFRRGERSATDLLTRELRISSREAKRRVTLGTSLAPRISLTGEELEGRYPATTSAVQEGAIALDAAKVIVEALDGVRRRAVPEAVEAAEQALAQEARHTQPDLLQVQAALWAMRLDQDGAAPDEHEQREQRAFRFGTTDSKGLTPFSGRCPAEEKAELQALFDAHRRAVRFTIDGAEGAEDECEDPLPEWHEAQGEHRTKAQYDFDVLMGAVRAGMRAEADGSGGSLKTPHEVITVVSAEDLERQQGGGHPIGVLARFSLPTVERLQCGGSSRVLITRNGSEPLWLGHPVRLFSPAQKKTLAARDGGCAWPGCTAPVSWCDAHHIRWHQRDRGGTDIENGVLLCSFHHHRIHATKEWEIRLHQRQPHLVPYGWQGPPLPRHRMQQHPIHGRGTTRRRTDQ